jgi:hypothetical protein
MFAAEWTCGIMHDPDHQTLSVKDVVTDLDLYIMSLPLSHGLEADGTFHFCEFSIKEHLIEAFMDAIVYSMLLVADEYLS